MVRDIREGELSELLALYLHLHEQSVPQWDGRLEAVWRQIWADPNHHIVVAEEEGALVASCVCVITPNLTRNLRPYALVENVVTRADCRGRGLASACLAYAADLAREAGCYKMMLLTGAKDEGTLRFYERAGYTSGDKTAFVRWL